MNFRNDRLQSLRESLGLSQNKLAHLLNVSQTTIFRLEKGEREPSLQLLNLIADFFNVSVDYLLGRTDDPTPKGKEFDLSVYLPESVKETPEKLIEIGKYLLTLGEQLKRDLEK
ncbi:helix-turn-helix domain-containing protein [Thermosipho sp. 1074]|uniref:helix-turn-helix domain-containing protein n=1 Tax=Thermosipho sp. 1074 TaxID=1643331 RepID=UPI0009855E39|nr:helix-turn-helix transcriptional regulator [Thermosipho sp. 1074]OOC42163.1 hypothetical protein XO08_07715 [Thermosipho sp. 1074]